MSDFVMSPNPGIIELVDYYAHKSITILVTDTEVWLLKLNIVESMRSTGEFVYEKVRQLTIPEYDKLLDEFGYVGEAWESSYDFSPPVGDSELPF